jgi:2',3'-cyclic-nucleotide 2'-phosphodiesterase/3'-nucleotidase/5'-nucleotidase
MRQTVRAGIGGAVLLATLAGWNPPVIGQPPAKGITLSPIGVYLTGLSEEGAVEISAFDPESKRAFLTFAEQPRLDVVDLSDPTNPTPAGTIDLTPWGAGAHATSVAVYDGVLAVAVPQGEDDTAPGKALFFDTDGVLLSEVTVGALPDMIVFSPNGELVLTANEGQPNQSYTFDPEGSVSVIDVSGGAATLTDADVTDVGFSAYNGAALDPSIRIFGPGATVAEDFEPEYIAISHDSKTAWVTLQENNAIATIDLKSKTVTRLAGLGFKDHSKDGYGLDGSRDDKQIEIVPQSVWGMYQPDAIAAFRSRNTTYLVTANEGDVREYEGLNAAGEESVEIEDIALDPVAFPNAATMKHRTNGVGRLKVTAFNGDIDGDGDFDRLFTFGGRSFSIWSDEGALLFDSADSLEQLTAAAFPANFNASNDNNTMDDRSDDKGPEPEGVTVASLFGRTYLFVMLERIGGVVVYDIENPAKPELVQYINTRDFSEDTETAEAGDLGPEAARVVPAELSPNGKALLLVSNEASGSFRVFEITQAK